MSLEVRTGWPFVIRLEGLVGCGGRVHRELLYAYSIYATQSAVNHDRGCPPSSALVACKGGISSNLSSTCSNGAMPSALWRANRIAL